MTTWVMVIIIQFANSMNTTTIPGFRSQQECNETRNMPYNIYRIQDDSNLRGAKVFAYCVPGPKR
jgi:hypothetical protein